MNKLICNALIGLTFFSLALPSFAKADVYVLMNCGGLSDQNERGPDGVSITQETDGWYYNAAGMKLKMTDQRIYGMAGDTTWSIQIKVQRRYSLASKTEALIERLSFTIQTSKE